ncbi:MAG: serine hydrolase [Bacteroidota bacterium]
MKIRFCALMALLLASCTAQENWDDYLGGWAGTFSEPEPFAFQLSLQMAAEEGARLVFSGKHSSTELELAEDEGPYLSGRFGDQLFVRIDTSGPKPVGFIQSGHHLSFLELEARGANSWEGEWQLLIGAGITPTLYLSLDQFEDGNYGASTFFREPTYHYMFGMGFGRLANNDQQFIFRDIRSNIDFLGEAKNQKLHLKLSFLHETIDLTCSPLAYDQWQIGQPPREGVEPAIQDETFAQLRKEMRLDSLEKTHGVVIAQGGEIIFEQYTHGFTPSTPHDTRSLSKSFASAILGIAIEQGLLAHDSLLMKPFFEKDFPEVDWSDGKDLITLFHLLTMSSGLDVVYVDRENPGYASEDIYQSQEDWTGYILSAPMLHPPGEHTNYASANPHLLAPIIDGQLDMPLEFFIHQHLFGPLGITDYRMQTNNRERPYFGGGWYLTPRDLVKFGQLYMNRGKWEGKQLISEAWVDKSLAQHTVLENTRDKNGYGYFFWHHTYEVAGRRIASVEGRGAGGQYLFMVPELDLVVAITSGNYRNGKALQPERIMEDFILPELVK